MTSTTDPGASVVESLIPARRDRLQWSRFPTRLIVAQGTAWILHGLEITLASAVGGGLTNINSAIDEMIPARYRGPVDIGVNGTYWAGSIIGTLVSPTVPERRRPKLG
jgi:hypothetical protein